MACKHSCIGVIKGEVVKYHANLEIRVDTSELKYHMDKRTNTHPTEWLSVYTNVVMQRGVLIINKNSTQNGNTSFSFSTVYTYYMRGNRWARVEKLVRSSW